MPSMHANTAVPRRVRITVAEEELGTGLQPPASPIPHFEDADLVGGAEAVLVERRMRNVWPRSPSNDEHGIDDVLDGLGPAICHPSSHGRRGGARNSPASHSARASALRPSPD